MGTDDGDDDFGRCPSCGEAWFAITRPPDVVPGSLSAQDDLVAAGVCITPDGSITGYAGVLTCLECGEHWRPKAQRPFLRLIEGGQMEAGFDEIVSDHVDDLEVVSFTQNPDDFLPEITATGFDVGEFDRALGLAFKGLLAMGLTAIGFFADDEFDEMEDEWE